MESSSSHINNLNRVLKNTRSDIMADFVYSDQAGIMIVTNKITSSLDLQIIERYVKNANQIDLDNVKTPQLPQLKLFLKIISISYFLRALTYLF